MPSTNDMRVRKRFEGNSLVGEVEGEVGIWSRMSKKLRAAVERRARQCYKKNGVSALRLKLSVARNNRSSGSNSPTAEFRRPREEKTEEKKIGFYFSRTNPCRAKRIEAK